MQRSRDPLDECALARPATDEEASPARVLGATRSRVITAAVVIPQAMAYATIAGLPVQIGLYTALVPLLVYALLGTLAGVVGQHHLDACGADRGGGRDGRQRRPGPRDLGGDDAGDAHRAPAARGRGR